MILRLSQPSEEEIAAELAKRGADRADAVKLARMSGGSMRRAVKLLTSEEERALRDGAITALLAAMNAVPDFRWTKVKRDRADHLEANELMLLACHDLMLLSCSLPAEFFPDRANELKNAALRFTIGDIGCIIRLLTENAERLSTNAPGGASFDRLFASVAEIGLKNKKKD